MTGCSVIMVSYHTGAVLFQAIEHVLAQKNLSELIVVDNGNPPDVLARLRALPVRLVSGHGNIGFAGGCNLGASYATAEYILLLNPDCLPEQDALVHLKAALEANPDAMMAGGLLLNPNGTEQRGGRRQLLTPQTALSEALGLYRFTGAARLNNNETPTPQQICEVPAISGACMFLRREDYLKLGGMDEGYFLHVEDMDLCWRVHAAGEKILFVPEARVVHLLSTSEAPAPFIEWCKAKGFMRYFHKYFSHGAWCLLLLPLYAAILLRAALRMLAPRRKTR